MKQSNMKKNKTEEDSKQQQDSISEAKKNKKDKKNEDFEDAKIQDEESYSRYRVDDIDFISQTSEEDIETKMNKMIEIKHQGGDIQEYINSKDKLQPKKENVNKLQKRKEIKEESKKMDDRPQKIQKELEKFKCVLNSIIKRTIFFKLKKNYLVLKKVSKASKILVKLSSKLQKSNKMKNAKKFLNLLKERKEKMKQKEAAEKLKKDQELKEKAEKLKKEQELKEKEEKLKKEQELKEKAEKEEKKTETKNPTKIEKVEENKKADGNDNLNKKAMKIQSKKKRLELIRKKEEEYIKIVDLQTKRRQEEMRLIEDQLNIQNDKYKKYKEGLDVSGTNSEIEIDLNPEMKIENGLAFLSHFYKNHLIMLEYDFVVNFYRSIGYVFENKAEIEKEKMRIKRFERKNTTRQMGTKKNKKNEELSETGLIDDVEYSYGNVSEEDSLEDTFIQVDRVGDIHKPIDKSQLVEYDRFYKEQFFKNEVFKYDVDNIQDKEVQEINHEINKLDVKRRLTEKKKLKEVNVLKGLDVTDLEAEIEDLEKEYEKAKTVEEPKLELIMNNTEGLLYKGRILGYYFNGKAEGDFPRFALENEKSVGAKEVIDFKPLRKEEQARRFYDYWCCLQERKKINKWLVYTRFWCKLFIDNWIFDNLSLGIILANTVLILISDPTDSNNIGNTSDSYFLYFYTLEAIFKIIAFKFVSGEEAYIKDYWNILDFFVVIVGWVSFILERAMNGTKISGLAGLRAFRILRPLKTVKRFKGLKKLVTALLGSIAHLGETTIVLVFFFLIFAIAGRQMWQGMFYRRCMNVNYGYLYSTQGDDEMCSFDSDCSDLESYGMRFICAKGYRNPDSGAINFDNVLTGFVTIFVMVTLEGWTTVFIYVSKTFKDKIYVNPIIIFAYFHLFVFLGSFYLINLFLAVTNAEFEHIEKARKELVEKMSFFKLIQTKYDLKEKEKKDKKEKQRKAKENNNKKSDQALRDLYYKVKDEAFHINKNRRNIPILYSTVKDMYIMANNNPEELYLQEKRIDEEEDLLCEDIKRQQREIDILIDEKVKEIKKTTKDKTDEKEEDKNTLSYNPSKTNTLRNSVTQKKTFVSFNFKKENKVVEELTEEMEKLIKKINPDLIELSIDNTQKYIKDQMIQLTKVTRAAGHEDKERDALRRKIEKKEMKQAEMNEISIREDLPYESLIKKEREKLEKQLEEQNKKDNLEDKAVKKKKLIAGGDMNKSMAVAAEIEKSQASLEKNQEIITDTLSFMTDLSLSNVNDSFSRVNNLKSLNTMGLLKRSDEKEHTKKKEDEKDNELEDTNRSLISHDSILTERNIILNADEGINEKARFKKPVAILSSVLKLQKDAEVQMKLDKMREKFNLVNFLKKETDKGTKINTLTRRKSFLQFLEYTQKPENLDDYLLLQEKSVSDINQINTKLNPHQSKKSIQISKKSFDFMDEDNRKLDSSFMSKDSHLSIEQNVSINDIKLIPDEIKEDKVIIANNITSDDIIKNLESNKLTQMIRNSVFDRSSVNTNINLTSKEQTRYFRNINRKLNENLYNDLKKPRGRKNNDLDISHVAEEKNYEEFLQPDETLVEAADDDDNNVENNNNITDQFVDTSGNLAIGTKTMKSKADNSKEIDNKQTVLNINKLIPINKANNNKNAGRKDKKAKGFYIFKAKSIEKNNDKYPKENSNDFKVREENKPYTDPLTVKQEMVPENFRGKKYYLNYLYNIADKDLKVKDTFKVDHWVSEILGKKEKFIKKKPLPETTEAFFVFNDKKLNLKKYRYSYHKDYEYADNECAYLTNNLKYLPKSVLEVMPMRLRDFGKFAVNKPIKAGTLGVRPNLINISNTNKSQVTSTNSRSGKTFSKSTRNSTSIVMSSAFSNHYRVMEEIKYKKGLHERVYKKIDEFNYRTLAHYLTNEELLYSKFIDEKKREEKLNKMEMENRIKQSRLEVKTEIVNISIFDLKTNSHRYVQWSGADVLSNIDEDVNRKRWNNMINSLEDFNMIIWNDNVALMRLQKVRYAFYILATSDYFDITILAIVIINSIFMALDGNLFKSEIVNNLNIANTIFNSIFYLEYVVKFIGLSPLVYYSDGFSYLDTVIIAFAILDMATPSANTDEIGTNKTVSSQLSFLRVFRIFRVIRLTKILRRLKSMRLIIGSMKKALISVSYIVCILVMFILIFELLGMSLLSGNIHYQTFSEGFYTTYQILTIENWDGLLVELWPMSYFSFFYFVAWIFLGNYIIFNLFTSILLQSFGEEGEEEDDDDLTEDEIIEKMYVLPDYLYSIKLAEKEHRPLESVLKRRNNISEDVDDGDEEENNEGDDSNNNINTTTKDMSLNKLSSSGVKESSVGATSMMSSESDESDSSESDEDENDDKVYNGIDKNIKEWAKINKLFRKNECENSFYLLSQTNKFRIFCMKLMNNKWFDRFILLMILLSTARLIADTFLAGYTFVLIFDFADAVFNLIFLLEAVVKICALGFVMDEGSYLRDNWNKIDIIIVICSIFDFENLVEKYIIGNQSTSSVQFLKVLRLLRTLRPLRFISHNVQLKLIITSLFDSILPILNALFIVIVVYYMFSIVGINLFYESLHNCYVLQDDGSFKLAISSFNNNLADYEIKNDMSSISTFCANKYNGIMDTGPAFKFSNIITSFIASYVLSTQEGWPDIMNSYRIYGDIYGAFFIIYNLVVAYFFLNLFTGIMFRYYNEAFTREQKLADNDKKAPKYYDFLTQITSADCDYAMWNRPAKGNWRYYLREFADSTFLDNTIMAAIFLNMVSMAMNYENCHETYSSALTYANYVFTGIFMAECVFKLFAYGIEAYFSSTWNRFDFFVVMASILDLIIANIDGIDAAFLKSFQIIRVLRVLRVTRVLRLVKALKGLEKLIQTLTWSITALANVLLLMIIIFCIFAILGCYFYDTVTYETYKDNLYYINEYYNLNNFYYAFLLTFRAATGESWHNIMMELVYIDPDKVSEAYGYIYMIVSNFITSIIMLNLFLMVTLQQYDEFTNKNYNPIEKFESFLVDFNNAWNKYSSPEDKGYRIKKILVTNFFMDFNWKKLNFPEQGKLEYVKKFVSELKLRTDKDDNVYYLDVVCKVIMKQMGSQVDRANPDNVLILKTEKKVQDEINKMINKYIGLNNTKKKNNIIITFNPLTSHLYFKISYLYIKTFINYYKENSELLHHLDEEQLAGSEMENEEDIEEEEKKNEDVSGLIGKIKNDEDSAFEEEADK